MPAQNPVWGHPVSDRSAALLNIIPDDCRLIGVTACSAALGVSERKLKSILDADGVPVIELGARTRGVRLSHMRALLTKRESA